MRAAVTSGRSSSTGSRSSGSSGRSRNVEALVADAVGRFDKAHPERAFSKLGPLTRRFPRAATVRFHLGVLLLWLGELEEARQQLNAVARDSRTRSVLAREANRLLTRLEDVQGR
jgi:hypothetical protein